MKMTAKFYVLENLFNCIKDGEYFYTPVFWEKHKSDIEKNELYEFLLGNKKRIIYTDKSDAEIKEMNDFKKIENDVKLKYDKCYKELLRLNKQIKNI